VRTRAIGEDVIVAMYMNNRAVEALARKQLDDAYWWAREATVQAPAFLTPYNTLGAIYQRHGNLKESERVLTHVLDRQPDNIQAMSNLIVVLNSLGRVEESQRLSARLKQMDPDPPFGYFNRGMAAMRDGDVKAAKEAFAKEVARAPDYHEFNFWLAVAYLNLGEVEQARKYLTIAMKNSTTRRDHDLYAAKLDRLNAARTN
jgi:predicted Zn-dependent protease